MSARAIAALVLTVLSCAVLSAQLPGGWAHWEWFAPVQVAGAASTDFVGVVIPPALGGKAQRDWADLRVIDDTGAEQPFVIRAHTGGATVAWRNARLLDPGWVPGQYSQATFDLGSDSGVHNRVRIDVRPGQRDFLTWVEIAVSADARTWQIARDRAPIYRLSRAGLGTVCDATYPDSIQRYVRVRVLDGAQRYDIIGGAVARQIARAAELVPASVTFSRVSGAADRTVWLMDQVTPGLAIGEVRLETTTATFDRPLLIEASDDGQTWARAGEGAVSRRADGGATQPALAVRVEPAAGWPAASAARWRVTIYNGNDEPLANARLAAFELPRRVVFRAAPGHTYRVLAGNARATTPAYDLARSVDASIFDAARPASIGEVTRNASYADPAPWTERHPAVLWTAVALAALALGALAVRTLRASG
jgi:hypothetical protein